MSLNEQLVKPTSLGGFVRAVSGLFITTKSPGLSPKELEILCLFILYTGANSITREDKVNIANQTNLSVQVVTNYVSRLKKRGVISKDNKIHPLFFKHKIVIEWINNSSVTQ